MLRALGTSSQAPERFGADVLLTTKSYGAVGIQRKEVNDLIASIHDGRLQKELQQMKTLGLGVLLVEGTLRWTEDGQLLSSSPWTVSQHLGVMWSVQSRGFWIASTDHLRATCNYISTFTRWLAKSQTSSLNKRPGATSVWGSVNSRDWALHLLQSFQGIGYDLATAIYDHFGRLPLTWTVNELDLQQVPGIGPKRAQNLIDALVPSSLSKLLSSSTTEVS